MLQIKLIAGRNITVLTAGLCVLFVLLLVPFTVSAQSQTTQMAEVIRKANYGISFFYNDKTEIFTENVSNPTPVDDAIYELIPKRLVGRMAMIGVTQEEQFSIINSIGPNFISKNNKNPTCISIMAGLVESSVLVNKPWEDTTINFLDFSAQFIRLKIKDSGEFLGVGLFLDKIEGSFKFRADGGSRNTPDRNFSRTTGGMFWFLEFEFPKNVFFGYEMTFWEFNRKEASRLVGSDYNDFFDKINTSGATLRIIF